MTIKTWKYGNLPIAKNKTWLKEEVIDTIEEANSDNFYEVRQTLNGKLVALLV